MLPRRFLTTMPTEKTTELASQAGQVFCVGSRLRGETMSRPLAYFRRITGEKALCSQGFACIAPKKTAHSAGYLMKRGREFKSRLDHHPVPQFSDFSG
jgi:hypothetical protein